MVLRAWLGASALALLLVTSGCSDDPQPKVEPTVESPAPSPTETTPDEPQAWEVKSKAGAVAFAKHWVDVFSEAMSTSRTGELRALSQNTCDVCTAFADRLDEIRDSGGFYDSDGWTVANYVVSGPDSGRVVLGLNLKQASERYRESRHGPVVEHPAGRAAYSMILVWDQGQWAVTELRLA